MPDIKEIIDVASGLPVEKRAIVIDALMRTIDTPSSPIDKIWIATAERRLQEIESGRMATIPGKELFQKAAARFIK